jgi:hypothetical protein
LFYFTAILQPVWRKFRVVVHKGKIRYYLARAGLSGDFAIRIVYILHSRRNTEGNNLPLYPYPFDAYTGKQYWSTNQKRLRTIDLIHH